MNLGVLKNLSRAKKYSKGIVISSSNSVAAMYIVLKGEIGVYSDYRSRNQELVATVRPGEFFGETALFLDKALVNTAVALTEVIALPVYRNNAVVFLRDEPEMAFELLKAMSGRMDKMGAAYESLCGHPNSEPKAKPAPLMPATKEQDAATAAMPTQKNVPQDATPQHFSLFPEEHGRYQLPIDSTDRVHLMEKSYVCPICKKEFKALRIKNSQLVLESTDSDMRNRYIGVEPMYYDVVTCPNCLYSALTEMFSNPDKPNADQLRELQPLQAHFHFGTELDTESVFAGYYLALFCAPVCFIKSQMATAKLLLRLGRIYQDCGEKKLEIETAKKALDAYLNVYQTVEIAPNQEQQLCLVIGELSLKLNDLTNAKNYFFRAKTNRDGTARLKDHAEGRLQEIHEMLGGSQAGA